MQTLDYYSGSTIDPNDTSDQFVVSARELYRDQQMQDNSNPYFSMGGQQQTYQTPPQSMYQQQQYYQQPVMQPQNVPYQAVGNLHYGTVNPCFQPTNPVLQGPNMGQIQTPNVALAKNLQFGGQTYGQPQNFAPRPQIQPQPYNYGGQQYFQDGGPGYVSYRAPGYAGNPALNYLAQRQQAGYSHNPIYFGGQQQQDRVVHIPGADPTSSGKYLFSADTQEKLDKMQVDMFLENEELQAKREMQLQRNNQSFLSNNPVNYGYYGGLGYGGYGFNRFGIDPQIYNRYKAEVEKMATEAEERRTNFNKNLSKLCHNWLGIEVSDDQLDRTYTGYTYTVPAEDITFIQNQARFENQVPVNTAAAYWVHDANVTAEFRKYCPDGRNLNEFLNDLTLLNIREAEEAERHRRMDGKQFYDQDIFHSYMRKYAREKLIDDSVIDYSTASKGDIMKHLMGKSNLEEFRKEGITINDDGTFNYNIGAKAWNNAPDSLKEYVGYKNPVTGEPLSRTGGSPPVGQVIQNENVANYQYSRSKFFQSIYDTDKKINYDDGSGTGNMRNLSPPINNLAGGG